MSIALPPASAVAPPVIVGVPVLAVDVLLTTTVTAALWPSTSVLTTLPSPVKVNATVDPSASAVSPIAKTKSLLSPVAVMLSVMFSQLVQLVLSQLNSTSFESPVNTQVPV